MLSCRQVTERTSDYVDAGLSWRGRLQMRLHLIMCRFCREYVRQVSLVIRMLPRLPRPGPSDELTSELRLAFRKEAVGPRPAG